MSVATWVYRPKSDKERERVERALEEKGYSSYASFVRDACISFAMSPDEGLAEVQEATETAWRLIARLRAVAKSYSGISGEAENGKSREADSVLEEIRKEIEHVE